MRILFYNTENFFDCDDDSLRNDEEFLPDGLRGWTPYRFYRKAGNIARVLATAGGDRFPELVGLAEVENAHCLETLVRHSPLRNAGYSYAHFESDDPRGVDVALLYNRYWFRMLHQRPIAVVFEGEPDRKTRDILNVSGMLPDGSALQVFVCHFPSRLGGKAETETYRRQAARRLRSVIDSLLTGDPVTQILVMGDFNDHPDDKALQKDLGAMHPDSLPSFGPSFSPDRVVCSDAARFESYSLANLMLAVQTELLSGAGFSGRKSRPTGRFFVQPLPAGVSGTHKNGSDWGMLDHLMVSDALLKKCTGFGIHAPDYLLVPDERWLGMKPFRTWYGMSWQGGYSDHLPIWVDLSVSMLP